MGGVMKYFSKKLLGHEIFRSMVSPAKNFLFEKFVKHSGPSSYILNVRSLRLVLLEIRKEETTIKKPSLIRVKTAEAIL